MIFILPFFVFDLCCVEIGSSRCSSGYLWTACVTQVDLKLVAIILSCPPESEITDCDTNVGSVITSFGPCDQFWFEVHFVRVQSSYCYKCWGFGCRKYGCPSFQSQWKCVSVGEVCLLQSSWWWALIFIQILICVWPCASEAMMVSRLCFDLVEYLSLLPGLRVGMDCGC